jgi:hypothetical protein
VSYPLSSVRGIGWEGSKYIEIKWINRIDRLDTDDYFRKSENLSLRGGKDDFYTEGRR